MSTQCAGAGLLGTGPTHFAVDLPILPALNIKSDAAGCSTLVAGRCKGALTFASSCCSGTFDESTFDERTAALRAAGSLQAAGPKSQLAITRAVPVLRLCSPLFRAPCGTAPRAGCLLCARCRGQHAAQPLTPGPALAGHTHAGTPLLSFLHI